MDEPLSNLDAKLRVELREDIRDLQRSLGITTIYVTHDQEEALVISDRICIMQGGRVHQVATPLEVYGRPGDAVRRLVRGRDERVRGPPRRARRRSDDRCRDAAAAGVGRPHGGHARDAAGGRRSVRARTTAAARRSDRGHRGQGDLCRARSLLPIDDRRRTEDSGACRAARSGPARLAIGERLAVALPLAGLHAFDPADGRRIELRT